MKALKEKRVSLRSFLRRGLVILSLLALVFASCSESGGDEGGTNGSQPPTPTEPPKPTVVDIHILIQPQFESYQGLPANLTGMEAEVKWSDGTGPVILRKGMPEWENFYTAPCDEAWDYWDKDGLGLESAGKPYTKLYLQYKGSSETARLSIPHIVKADELRFTQTSFDSWYSDQRPKFDGMDYNVVFKEGWNGYPESRKSTATDKNPLLVKPWKMSTNYPKADYKNATAIKKELILYIGDTENKAGWDDTEGDRVEDHFSIDKYFNIFSVEFASAEWTKGGSEKSGYFDDDLLVFFNANATAPDPYKVVEQFKKSNVKFNITYTDGKVREQKDLSMEDFIANAWWYYEQKNLGPGGAAATGTYSTFMKDLIFQSDGLVLDKRGNVSILNVGIGDTNADESLETAWSVILNYAPVALNQNAGYPVTVPVQVYTFEDAEAKKLGVVPWIDSNGMGAPFVAERPFRTGSANTADEFEGIAAMWALTGSYTNDRLNPKNPTRTIPLTKEMFYAGYQVAKNIGTGSTETEAKLQLANASFAVGTVFLNQLGGNASMWNYSTNFGKASTLAVGDWVTDFTLPFYYRDSYSQDREEGIVVNVRY